MGPHPTTRYYELDENPEPHNDQLSPFWSLPQTQTVLNWPVYQKIWISAASKNWQSAHAQCVKIDKPLGSGWSYDKHACSDQLWTLTYHFQFYSIQHWRMILNSQPHQVIIFRLRIRHAPLYSHLNRIQPMIPPVCHLCEAPYKTTTHLFFQCPSLQDILKEYLPWCMEHRSPTTEENLNFLHNDVKPKGESPSDRWFGKVY